MRKFTFTLMAILLSIGTLFAQSPNKMSYQAVVRDSDSQLVANTQVGMRISILQGSENGTAEYIETQVATTNGNGLVSIVIGEGSIVNGDFAAIDWANGPYFIKTETAIGNSTNYTISGTSQLLSVPYALYAGNMPAGNQMGDMQYWDGSSWVILESGNEGATLQMVNGRPTWVGGTAGVQTVINPITGAEWMDRNLGATQVATSMTDTEAYGFLYQWGRGNDGHQYRTSNITTTLSSSDNPGHGNFILTSTTPNDWRSPQNDNLWQGANGINNPCPAGFRVPTQAEWNAEISTWSSLDYNGAIESVLKLPCAGGRWYSADYNGQLFLVGSIGNYWTSNVDGTKASRLNFDSGHAEFYSPYRAYGYSVRCIKD